MRFVKGIFWDGAILSDTPMSSEAIAITIYAHSDAYRTSAVSYLYRDFYIDHFSRNEYEIVQYGEEDFPICTSLKEALLNIDKYLYDKAEAEAAEQWAKQEKEEFWQSILGMLQ